MLGIIKPKDNVIIEINDIKTGLTRKISTHNLVTTAGMNLLRDFLHDGNVPLVHGLTHLAVGTSTTSPATSQTALVTEVFRDTYTKHTKGSNLLTLKYYLSPADANGNTITEAGLFTSDTAGTMYARIIHDGIEKTSAVSITYNWELSWD